MILTILFGIITLTPTIVLAGGGGIIALTIMSQIV